MQADSDDDRLAVVEEDADSIETRICVAGPDAQGERLDRWLAASIPEFSRSHVQRLIEAGDVRLKEQVITQVARRVTLGQSYHVLLRPTAQASAFRAEALPLSVVYEDDAVIVIDKPAGMVMHPAAGNWSGTVLNALLAHVSGAAALPRAGIVHRLDKDTSGLFVAGKTAASVSALSAAISSRAVTRIYLAIAHGAIDLEAFSVNVPIGRDAVSRVRMAAIASGRPARTDVRVLGRGDAQGKAVTAIECRLHTGRTHQIRVHLAHAGHPLVGDVLYGGRALLGLSRQALHARRLAFAHPVDGRPMAFESNLPPDLAAAWTSAFGTLPDKASD